MLEKNNEEVVTVNETGSVQLQPIVQESGVDFFALLPRELQLDILVRAVSFEMPTFLQTIGRLEAVSHHFQKLTSALVDAPLFKGKDGEKNITTLFASMKSFKDSTALAINHRSHPAYQSYLFSRCDELERVIRAKKIREGVFERNRFIMPGGKPSRILSDAIGFMLLTGLIYGYVQFIQCSRVFVHESTGNERIECMLDPLTRFWQYLFSLDKDTSVLLAALLLGVVTGTSGFSAALVERFCHLIVDSINLMILKYKQETEFSRIAGHDEFYQLCKQMAAILKWQNILAQDEQTKGEIEAVKQSKMFGIVQKIIVLGDQLRASRTKMHPTPPQNAEAEPLLRPLIIS
ncbi:hypothetical protein AQULUS_17900 [Aquicella lusitana]|uniref:Uncharacterized protein n=2 Tax=Aquicella lusitana TaxID=254246 RepID=A0A370GZ71_9COXI|nr:hypothetical protein C8D86_10223 [Aquicella lusitana]VVC74027.1 hypothetical protein AQULUS_17900 [Aquicella lusitana]